MSEYKHIKKDVYLEQYMRTFFHQHILFLSEIKNYKFLVMNAGAF